MNKQLTTTWLERDDVVLFVKTTDGWRVTQNLAKGNEYWLCHEKHEEVCLHWLNGLEVVALDEIDVTCADDLDKKTQSRCIYSGKYNGRAWHITEWYMHCSVISEVKSNTINVNGFEVPEPVREPLKDGDTYYFPSVGSGQLSVTSLWVGCAAADIRLNRGLIHLTKENAIAHAKAMLGINPNDVSN